MKKEIIEKNQSELRFPRTGPGKDPVRRQRMSTRKRGRGPGARRSQRIIPPGSSFLSRGIPFSSGTLARRILRPVFASTIVDLRISGISAMKGLFLAVLILSTPSGIPSAVCRQHSDGGSGRPEQRKDATEENGSRFPNHTGRVKACCGCWTV